MRTLAVCVVTAVLTAAAIKLPEVLADGPVQLTCRDLFLTDNAGNIRAILCGNDTGAAFSICSIGYEGATNKCVQIDEKGLHLTDAATQKPIASIGFDGKPIKLYRPDGRLRWAR